MGTAYACRRTIAPCHLPPDREVYADDVELQPIDWTELPLGKRFEGDWRLEGRIEVPRCGSEGLHRVDVTLTFENARLAVTPREPTLVERIADDDLTGRGTLFGGLFHRDPPRPSPQPLVCPEPSGDR